MRRTALAIRQVRVRDVLYFSVALPKPGGGRTRRFFRDKSEAQTYLELCRIEQRNRGLAAFSLSESLRVETVECSTALREIGATLRDATKFYLDHQRAGSTRLPCNPGKRLCIEGKRIGYPAWIRTMNNASKGRCVTVTPRGTADFRFSSGDC